MSDTEMQAVDVERSSQAPYPDADGVNKTSGPSSTRKVVVTVAASLLVVAAIVVIVLAATGTFDSDDNDEDEVRIEERRQNRTKLITVVPRFTVDPANMTEFRKLVEEKKNAVAPHSDFFLPSYAPGGQVALHEAYSSVEAAVEAAKAAAGLHSRFEAVATVAAVELNAAEEESRQILDAVAGLGGPVYEVFEPQADSGFYFTALPDSSSVCVMSRFRVRNLTAIKEASKEVVERGAHEAGTLYRGFTATADQSYIHSRDCYVDAASLLAHVADVRAIFQKWLTEDTFGVELMELHGPALELLKAKPNFGPLGGVFHATDSYEESKFITVVPRFTVDPENMAEFERLVEEKKNAVAPHSDYVLTSKGPGGQVAIHEGYSSVEAAIEAAKAAAGLHARFEAVATVAAVELNAAKAAAQQILDAVAGLGGPAHDVFETQAYAGELINEFPDETGICVMSRFKVRNLAGVRVTTPMIINLVRNEAGVPFLGFSATADQSFYYSRDCYKDGASLLAHQANTRDLFTTFSSEDTFGVASLELHGRESELAMVGPFVAPFGAVLYNY